MKLTPKAEIAQQLLFEYRYGQRTTFEPSSYEFIERISSHADLWHQIGEGCGLHFSIDDILKNKRDIKKVEDALKTLEEFNLIYESVTWDV